MPRRPSSTSPQQSGGLRRILVATAIAGAAGYMIQAIAGWGLTPADYAAFGVFWAAFYLVVGALAGIQQEIARASRIAQAREAGSGRKLLAFAGVVAGVVAVVIGVTAAWWAPAVFGPDWVTPLLALAVGAVAYVAFSTISGLLYGRSAWSTLSIVIVSDPVLRIATVGLALAFGAVAFVPWAVVLPVLLTAALSFVLLAASRAGGTVVAEPFGRLLKNVTQTVGGSAATAVLISALPMFVVLSASEVDTSTVGAFIFNLTITRAPLVIPILALQGWLVVRFRGTDGSVAAGAMRMVGAIVGIGVVIGAIAWFAVPPVVGAMFGDGYVLEGWVSAAIVVTASLTGALCATGALAIARSAHRAYLMGWVLAAVLSVALLFLPIDFEARVLIALTVGPVVGLAIHLGYFVAVDRRRSAQKRVAE